VWKNRPGGRNIAASNSNLIVDDEGALWYLNDETTNFQRALIRLPQPELRLKGEHLLIENEADRLDSIDGRSLTGFGALLTDHEGNVWASYGPGVARFSLRVLRPIKLEKDRPSGGVLTTIGAVNGGGVVISSDGNSNFTYLVHDGRVRRVKLPSAFLECLSRVRSGKTWLATQDGLWRWTDGQFVKAMSVDGLGTKRVRAIAEDGSGALWVSIVRSGIFKRVGNSWQLNGGVSALPNLAPLSLTDDSAGSIWATYPDGRAIQISGEVAHIYGELDGLNVGAVLAVYAKRRNTWVGGDAGLARLDGGRFVSVVSDEPAALKKITGIVETESGDLWLSTAAGIVHITSTEILRAQSDPLHRVSTEIFDSRTGLEGSGARFASLPTLIEGTDGILWVVTSVSTYSIDPNKVHRSPLPPKVSIQSFLVDNRAVATSGNVMLPVGSSSIQFSFAGLSLTAAEQVRYRYRLDGFDHDWVSSQKRRDAFYMNLSPGTYTFHVQARISGVQWSESEASVTFNIEPTFTQTKSFIVLILTGALLIIWIVDGIRARKLARQLRIALVARLEERERIAQELHDTLLQDTMGFTLTVHGAASRLAADDPVRKLLEQAAEQGEQGVRQGRDRIADLRARSAEDDDLAKSLTEAGAQWIAEDGKTDFEVQTLGRTRSLHPNAHDDAYRIAREAIINARRHARARHIQVQLIFGEDLFTLRVRDDGGGIDPSLSQARARAGHMGLPGMRQRAGAAGGTLTIQSEAGGGTEVEFNLAAALAYWQPLGRAPWRAWRSVCGWLARRRVRTTPPVEPESTE
jgi:signal transduction histidine kinase